MTRLRARSYLRLVQVLHNVVRCSLMQAVSLLSLMQIQIQSSDFFCGRHCDGGLLTHTTFSLLITVTPKSQRHDVSTVAYDMSINQDVNKDVDWLAS